MSLQKAGVCPPFLQGGNDRGVFLLSGGVLRNDHTAKPRMDGTWLGTLYYYRTLTTVADTADVLGRGRKAAALPANAQTIPDGLRLGEGEYVIEV